jgi:hypothetical protein
MLNHPQCDRCLYNAHNPHLLCAVHPEGIEEESCIDFRSDPKAQDGDFWSPTGYFWYGGELIPITPPRLTPEEQLEILDSHPFFTGVCPSCGHGVSIAVEQKPPLRT